MENHTINNQEDDKYQITPSTDFNKYIHLENRVMYFQISYNLKFNTKIK